MIKDKIISFESLRFDDSKVKSELSSQPASADNYWNIGE